VSGYLYLDWPILTLSIFNTIILLWLGLIVLLNAERRHWGVYLVGGGFILGWTVFLSHTILIGSSESIFSLNLELWWRFSWIPEVLLPFGWYVAMLWYGGYWDDPDSSLHRRHTPWLWFTGALTLVVGLYLALENPAAELWRSISQSQYMTTANNDFRWLVLGYPVVLLLCLVLSMEVLRHPGPSTRVMGALARRRARPWLLTAGSILLVASLFVGSAIGLVLVQLSNLFDYQEFLQTLAWVDLVTLLLVTLAILAAGQAVVSYEIFTGRTLPRRGLSRYWQRALALAAGYSLLTALALELEIRPVFSLMLATLIMTVFYALLGWRLYAERDLHFRSLRPFVSGQKLYETLINLDRSPGTLDIQTAFISLCSDVLEAQSAYLIPTGSMAPLVGPPMSYPLSRDSRIPVIQGLLPELQSPQTLVVSLEPDRYGDARWAAPLWSERGLIGVLLVGERVQGGLYTQEEMEIARTVGERLIDLKASAEVSQRLMALQRQRIATNQVLDQQTRRVVHDEVLPQLHAAMLALSEGQGEEGTNQVGMQMLTEVHLRLSDLLREIPVTSSPQVARLGLLTALEEAIESEFKPAFNEVRINIDQEARARAEELPAMTAEVVYYAAREAVRNAAQHARSDGQAGEELIDLTVSARWDDGLMITIEDNGCGIEHELSDSSQDGHGLALHGTLMAVLGGSLSVESVPSSFTRIILHLPQSATPKLDH
jgi:two-component sensor histidine kinase